MLLCYVKEFVLTFHLILLAWFWNKIKVVVSEKEIYRKVEAYNNPQISVLCCLKCAVTGHTTTVLFECYCRAEVLHVLSLLLWSLCLVRSLWVRFHLIRAGISLWHCMDSHQCSNQLLLDFEMCFSSIQGTCTILVSASCSFQLRFGWISMENAKRMKC